VKTLGRYVIVGAVLIAIDFVALALADFMDEPGIRTVGDVLAMLFFVLDIPLMMGGAALLAGVSTLMSLAGVKPHPLGIAWSTPELYGIRFIQDILTYAVFATCVHFAFRLWNWRCE
jgi:hypothetical protein